MVDHIVHAPHGAPYGAPYIALYGATYAATYVALYGAPYVALHVAPYDVPHVAPYGHHTPCSAHDGGVRCTMLCVPHGAPRVRSICRTFFV